MKSWAFISKVLIWAFKLLTIDFGPPLDNLKNDANRFISSLTNLETWVFKVKLFEEKSRLFQNYRDHPPPPWGNLTSRYMERPRKSALGSVSLLFELDAGNNTLYNCVDLDLVRSVDVLLKGFNHLIQSLRLPLPLHKKKHLQTLLTHLFLWPQNSDRYIHFILLFPNTMYVTWNCSSKFRPLTQFSAAEVHFWIFTEFLEIGTHCTQLKNDASKMKYHIKYMIFRSNNGENRVTT